MNFTDRAELIILPAEAASGASASARHDLTVGEAIRHVIEVAPTEERSRAVVRTPTRLLFAAEIEALFDTMPARKAGDAEAFDASTNRRRLVKQRS
jgi:hypothetical protein